MKRTILCLMSAGILALALCQTGCEPVTPDAKAASAPVSAPAAEPVLVPAPDLVIPAGAYLQVRLDHAISTTATRPGDRFTGSLVQPVTVDGRTALPRGIGVSGIVRQSAPSGRLKGRAVLTLALDRIELDGRSYQVATTTIGRTSAAHKKRNWALVGGGTGVGALIGGLAGGGGAALIGAGAGAAAGTIGAAATGRRQVGLPAESVLIFRTSQPLAVHTTS